MSRDMRLVRLEHKGLDEDEEWRKAIDIDIIANLYEKLMKEKFPLLKLDYGDVVDVLKEDGRISNLYDRLKYIDDLGCNEINKDEVLEKISDFIKTYTEYIKINPEYQLDVAEDILLFSLYKKYIPAGYIYYWE